MRENNSIKDYLAHKANGPAPIVKAEIPLRLGEGELLVVRRGRRTIEPKTGSSSGSRWGGWEEWPNGHCRLRGVVTDTRNG